MELIVISALKVFAYHVEVTPSQTATTGIACSGPVLYENPGFYGTIQRYFQKTVSYAIDPIGSPNIQPSAAKAAIDAAFTSWQSASNGAITFVQTSWATPQSCSTDRVIRFSWVTDPAIFQGNNANAFTTVTYDRATGEVIGAHVYFNQTTDAYGNTIVWRADASIFAIPAPGSIFMDLQAIATHEIGHALGLGHSDEISDLNLNKRVLVTAPAAVMAHDASRRNLTADDISGLNYIYSPDVINTFGTVAVTATLNGLPWSGSVGYYVTCPYRVLIGQSVPSSTTGVATGSCSFTFNGGGPPTILAPIIRPSTIQQLTSNQTVTYELAFRNANQPPTAGFTMSAQGQIATDGPSPLSLALQLGQSATVQFDASTRTNDSGGTISNWIWVVDGSPVTFIRGPQASFSQVLTLGSHTVSLTVSDNWGIPSSTVLGTINIANSSVSTWTQSFPATSPPERVWHAMAYDAARRQVVLFGGFYYNHGILLNDTWVWDGNNWTQKFPVNRPPARIYHAMTFDVAHNQVVLFGGFNSTNFGCQTCFEYDTWVWDGTNWSQKVPTTVPTVYPIEPAFAYDALHSQAVLFGGIATWIWDGNNWTQKFPSNSPPSRQRPAMIYDGQRKKIFLVGGEGSTYAGDAWTWDGMNWSQVPTPPFSGSMWSPVAAYEPQSMRTVFAFSDIVASNDIEATMETWIWNGSSWTKQTPSASPWFRQNGAAAYDSFHGQLVLFGGSGILGQTPNDTWVWPHP